MQQTSNFQDIVSTYYQANRRSMPWRDTPTPYYVVVSELMLQQTQVPRVLPKFDEFTARFPDFATLAAAPLADVLALWSGLGYNRRAKFLWESARKVIKEYKGEVPTTTEELVALPGIGLNTAGAILAYAYNKPVVFIETNIRTVIIHHFFKDDDAVTDKQIAEIVLRTLDTANPREWYWALMDYGTHLKQTVGTQLRKVHGHRTQSRFAGSRRQIRGQVLKQLITAPDATSEELASAIPDTRLMEVLVALRREGLISRTNSHWHLTRHQE